MEELEKRPQTWSERREQLRLAGQAYTSSNPYDAYKYWFGENRKYPFFMMLLTKKNEIFFWKTKEIVDAPIAISEERYPDIPNLVIVYITKECGNLSEFWHIWEHLAGINYHTCDARCETYRLPPYREMLRE